MTRPTPEPCERLSEISFQKSTLRAVVENQLPSGPRVYRKSKKNQVTRLRLTTKPRRRSSDSTPEPCERFETVENNESYYTNTSILLAKIIM